MKLLGRTFGLTFAALYLVRYHLFRLVMGERRAFTTISEQISKKPGWGGIYIRQEFYRRVLAHVGRDVYFGFLSLLSKPQVRIGDRVYIGRFCTIGWASIGDDVMLADGVQVLSGADHHGREAPAGQTLHDNEPQFERVTIGPGAWVGAGAIIMADVGAGAVVGAAAVVTKPVPPDTKVAGVPARRLDRPAGGTDRSLEPDRTGAPHADGR